MFVQCVLWMHNRFDNVYMFRRSCPEHMYLRKVKVKCTLVQALRLCTARTAHRGSRGIALPFLDHGTRMRWGVSSTPRPLFAPGEDPVPIVQETVWAPRPVWIGVENLTPTGIRSPDRPARSQSLYRLRYPAYIWNYKKAMKHLKQHRSSNRAGSKWCIVSSRPYFCCVRQTFRVNSAACSWRCSCSQHDTGCLCQTDLSSDDAHFPSTLTFGPWLSPCLFLCPSIPSRSMAGHCIKKYLNL